MENATKALLIAGAVLVSILIIGIGMMIYQSVTGTVQSGLGKMDQQEIDMFNADFQQYAGTNVTGSNVKKLVTLVKTSNNKITRESGEDDPRIVTCNITDENTVNAARRYSVTVEIDTNTGFVHTITITQAR